jgi:hypothetical protein
MTTQRILAVSGITRCGSTMMMRMLHKGGVDVLADTHVGYEDARNTKLPHEADWLFEARGKAVKLLDPHQYTPPILRHLGAGYAFIFMTRNPKEQAKSIAKFFEFARGKRILKKGIMQLRDSVRADTTRSIGICNRRGPTIVVRFEDVITRPLTESQRIAEFVGEYRFNVDPQRMADVVIPRTTRCYDGMLELQLKEDG